MGRVGQAGPAQNDLRIRAHRPQTLRKGVHRRRDAVDGVCRHIAHPLGLCQHTGQNAQQIGHLIGSGIIGAHQRVRRIQRTVQDAGARVLRRHLQAGGVHPGACGKHHIGIVVRHLFQHLLGVHFRFNVLPAGNEYPVRERLCQCFTSAVMGAHPCAVLRVVFVQEHHPQFTGLCKDIQFGKQRFARPLLRLQRKLHGLRLGQHLDLVPELFKVRFHLTGRCVAGVRVPVDRQIYQQRIPCRQAQLFAAHGGELLVEHRIEGRKIQPVIIAPALARSLAHQRLQLCIAAQLGKMDIIDLGELIEVQKLIIEPVFQAVVALRDEPGNCSRDLDRFVILEHRDALVALLHIELVQELIRNDRRVDALFQMSVAQVGPLGRKLGVRLQQRHKVGRKGRVPPAGLGADDALCRDLHQSKRLLRHNVDIDEDIVQHRQIRRLSACHTGTVSALSRLQSALVIFQHNDSFFRKTQCRARPCCIVQFSIP